MILGAEEDALQEVRQVPTIRERVRNPQTKTMDEYLGLRQAPPQRQLFQPDVSSSRQSRHATNSVQSPQPPSTTSIGYNYNPSSNPNNSSFTISNYEPRPQIPLTLRPVLTPGNNPILFKEKVKRMRELQAAKFGQSPPSYKGMMLPGSK